MSKKSERANAILEILSHRNGESLKSIAQELDVSEMTIRRDIGILQEKKLVTLIQGVAIYNHHPSSSILNKQYDFQSEKETYSDEKERIGIKAASLLKPNDVIVIDTGTTTEQLAKHLPADLNLTVVCYNMNTLMYVKEKTDRIIFGGGHYHRNTQMFQSPEGVALISRTNSNKAFISAAGVSSKLIASCIDQYETNTKKAAIESAIEKILLVDSSKFDRICPVTFATLKEFDVIITDNNLSEEWVQYIHDLDIKLFLV
ncbi:MAG: DeoR/GlpR family DNA-binding transcription regulator [Christensenella sp.]|nr:DeoR/GlpR family DNA-binding transcription regulator [Christensenella sp.]